MVEAKTAFTKELRQEIVREFAVRHNGQFDARLFFEEVSTKGQDHPAHGWFEWDKEKAAANWQIEQAREFARGLKVSFEIQEVHRDKSVSVRHVSAPLVMSPMSGRSKGGGYVLVDVESKDHMADLCEEAASSLRSWAKRYEAALAHAGAASTAINSALKALDGAVKAKEIAA